MQIPGKLTERDMSEVQALKASKNLQLERSAAASEGLAGMVGIWSSARLYLGRTPPVWADAVIAMVLLAIGACGIYFRNENNAWN